MVSLIPSNPSYRVMGPSTIDSGGVGAIDMMKGMGIAYGISGIGQLIGNVVRQSTEYENLMQTTRNILGAHDKGAGFDSRFKEMERIVRQVGVETKYSAPEVADAAKFLAMAGMNTDDITKAIAPIADIALVGDTELGLTADLMTNIMTAYDKPASELRHLEDIMTMTFTKTNTTITEMAESFKYSASLFSAAGVDFETSSAAIGILGDSGIKGSQAGTTMRTIMNNLLNPTKSQREAWERLGVARLDKDGNLRDINQIFADLSQKLNTGEMATDDFFKLFRLTAAQGAAALATHVEKWNAVIEQNFLSDGMVAQLAEAKKNTVQGLWYKLTSTITEGGLKAFEGLQGPIKDLLKETIDQLGSGKSVDFIVKLGHTLLDFVKFIKSFTIQLINLYKRFEGLINLWLKFQLIASTTVGVFRVFKSLLNIGGYALAFSRNIARVTSGNITLANSFKRLAVSARSGIQAAFGQNKTATQISQLGVGTSAASLVLGMIGSSIGSKMFEQGSAGQAIATIGGGFLGSMIPSLLLMGGPTGAIMSVVAALLLLIGHIASLRKEANLAKKATQDWIKSIEDFGVDTADISSPQKLMIANMNLFTGAIEDQNKQLELSQRLWDRYKKSLSGENFDPKSTVKWIETSFGEKFKNQFKDGWFNKGLHKESFLELLKAQGGHGTIGQYGTLEYYMPGSNRLYTNGSALHGKNMATIMLRAMANDVTNPIYNEVATYVKENMWAVRNAEELAKFKDKALSFIPAADPNLANVTDQDLRSLSSQELAATPEFNRVTTERVNDLINNAYGPWAEAFNKDADVQESLEKTLGYLLPATSNGLFDTSDKLSWNEFLTQATKNDPNARKEMAQVYELLKGEFERVDSKSPFYDTFKELINNEVWKDVLGDLYTNPHAKIKLPDGTDPDDSDNPSTTNFGSNYSTSAAPKQVIIKIENLMNVESIDMTDPNNQMAVSTLSDAVVSKLVEAANMGGNLIYDMV